VIDGQNARIDIVGRPSGVRRPAVSQDIDRELLDHRGLNSVAGFEAI
jgi:hypothetical protein